MDTASMNLAARLPLGRGSLGATHHAPAAQVRHEFFLQNATGLNEQAAVDGLMRQLHRAVIVMDRLEPACDLLRRPAIVQLPGDDFPEPAVDRECAVFGAFGLVPRLLVSGYSRAQCA